MVKTSIYDARNNLSSLIKQAEIGKVVELTRHAKPVAVLVGYESFTNSFTTDDFLSALKSLKTKYSNVLTNLTDDDFCFATNKQAPSFNN